MSHAMPRDEDCEFADGDRVKFRGNAGDSIEGIVFDVSGSEDTETVCIAYIDAKFGAQYVYCHASMIILVEAAPAVGG